MRVKISAFVHQAYSKVDRHLRKCSISRLRLLDPPELIRLNDH
jgi:hypothetical protein